MLVKLFLCEYLHKDILSGSIAHPPTKQTDKQKTPKVIVLKLCASFPSSLFLYLINEINLFIVFPCKTAC